MSRLDKIMAGFQGMRYGELLHQIVASAEERLGIVAKPQSQTSAQSATANGAVLSATGQVVQAQG